MVFFMRVAPCIHALRNDAEASAAMPGSAVPCHVVRATTD
jgi:hypothetical protein